VTFSSARRQDAGMACLLALVIGLGYWQVRGFTFVAFDDPAYLSDNLQVRAGLSLAGLRWAFTTFAVANWHPLTWLSHMADVTLFGLNPGAHHLVNVAFHAANSILCFLLLRDLTGSRWRSALVAALFALHPAHVESVAWLAERKDVLSTLFWFLTTYAYLGYVRRPTAPRYGLMALCFALGLLAKPMLVTLPLTLLLLDGWPLGRVRKASDLFALVREKALLFAMAGALAVVTLKAQSHGGAVSSFAVLPLGARLSNAALALVRYVGMALWPTRLAVFYPLREHPPLWKPLLAAAFLLGCTVLAAAQFRRRPWFALGWAWFLITLLPVIGIIQVGSQAMADRYTYLPFLGLFLIAAWALGEGAERLALPRWVPTAGACLWLGLLLVLTTRQVSTWRNTYTLFGHARQISGNTLQACIAMGYTYLEEGRKAEAVEEYRAGLRLAPRHDQVHHRLRYSLGRTLASMGQGEEAIRIYQGILATHPKEYEANFYIAQALELLGRNPEALQVYQALQGLPPERLAPGPSGQDLAFTIQLKVGLLLWGRGDLAEAGPHFLAATRRLPLGLDPRSHMANDYAARAQLVLGRPVAAAGLWRASLALRPDQPQIWYSLGLALGQAGQPGEAAQAFRRALALDPTQEGARIRLRTLEGARS
jgi:tetratricopeptide (TPR) repeat protein